MIDGTLIQRIKTEASGSICGNNCLLDQTHFKRLFL